MKIAVISDLHSNIVALEAVLKDIEGKQVDQIYCAGDLVGYSPFPNEVIDLIRHKQIPTVMGNYDDGIGFMRFICGCDYKDEKAQALGEQSIVWTKAHTIEENKDLLRNLPAEVRFTIDGKKILLVHGSPNRLNEYITEDTPRPRDYALNLIELNNVDILICGHTHIPFKMVLKDKFLINTGSVGKPKHGEPSAVYTIIEIGADIEVEFHKVPYDFEAVAKALEESDLPNEFAALIRSGKG